MINAEMLTGRSTEHGAVEREPSAAAAGGQRLHGDAAGGA